MHTKTSPIVKAIVGYLAALVLLVGTMGSAAFAQRYGDNDRDNQYDRNRQYDQGNQYGRDRQNDRDRRYDNNGRYGRGYYGPRLSSAQAVSIAANRFPGQVVGQTRLVLVGNQLAYQVNVRERNALRTVTIDANNGRILYTTITRTPQRGWYGYPRW